MPTAPTLAAVLRDMVEARVRGIYTATVGRVTYYNANDQTVSVELVMLDPINVVNEGELEHVEHPVLPDVPIAWPRAGGFSIFMPPKKGDHVLLIFTHESIANWRTTGTKSPPGDIRRHNLSHAVAYLGIAPQTDLLKDPPALLMPEDEMVLNGPGVIRVGSKDDAKFVALAEYVDREIAKLSSFITESIVPFLNAHTHVGVGPGLPGTPAAPPFADAIQAPQTVAATKLKGE